MGSEPNTLVEDYTQVLVDSEEATESFMAALEAILVSVIGRVGIWLTPLPSAFLVSRAADRIFSLGELSWLMAGIIELVGLVTANLWLNAQEWNRTRTQKDAEANEGLAFGLLMAYFVSTGLMLLAFEIPVIVETGNFVGLAALLFPCLSAVGIFALNERMLQHKRTSAKAERRQKQAARVSTGLSTSSTRAHSHVQNGDTSETVHGQSMDMSTVDKLSTKLSTLDALVDICRDNPAARPVDIQRQLGLPRSTYYKYMSELEQAGRIDRNGR